MRLLVPLILAVPALFAAPARSADGPRGAGPGLRGVGGLVPADDAAGHETARQLAGETDVIVADAAGTTPDARAAAGIPQLLRGTDAVWLAPSISALDADAVARSL